MPVASDLDAYYAFDAGAGSGVPTEDVWEAHFKHLALSGVLAGEPFGTTPNTTEFEVYGDSTGRQVKVRVGRCLMAGHAGWITAEKTLAIDTADATNPRIDLVVLRLNRTDNKIYLATVTGTPAATPAPPALTSTSVITEILLAEVAVAAGATTINAADVTSKRTFAVPDTRGWPTAKLVRTGSQTGIVTATETDITWQSVTYQTGGRWWYAATPTRLYVPRPGLYRFSCRVRWDTNGTGVRSIALLLNNTTRFATEQRGAFAGGEDVQRESGEVVCAAGDYVVAKVFQTSGANRTLELAAYAPELTGELIRPTTL